MLECAVCNADASSHRYREYFVLETEPLGGSVFLCSVEHLREWVRGL